MTFILLLWFRAFIIPKVWIVSYECIVMVLVSLIVLFISYIIDLVPDICICFIDILVAMFPFSNSYSIFLVLSLWLNSITYQYVTFLGLLVLYNYKDYLENLASGHLD